MNPNEMVLVNLTDDELAHYGVKGMRWGAKKASAKARLGNPGASKAGEYLAAGIKGTGRDFAIRASATLIKTIGRDNPLVNKGVNIVGSLLIAANTADTIANVAAIKKA
jgi:hypothetical protein